VVVNVMLPSPNPLHVTLLWVVLPLNDMDGSVIVTLTLLVQPLLSFTSIVYVPALSPVNVLLLAKLELLLLL
jgi:hypothetical protein